MCRHCSLSLINDCLSVYYNKSSHAAIQTRTSIYQLNFRTVIQNIFHLILFQNPYNLLLLLRMQFINYYARTFYQIFN